MRKNKTAMKNILGLITLLFCLNSISQNSNKIYYKDVSSFKILKLNERIVQARINNNKLKERKLFEKLLSKYIRGKYLSNYTFETIDNKLITIDEIDKSILLLIRGFTSLYNWREIEYLNELSLEHKDKLEIIILFYSEQSELVKLSEKFNKRINIVSFDKGKTDRTKITFNDFLPVLGFPSEYLISKNKKILNFKRGQINSSSKLNWDKATEINEQKMKNFIFPVLK